MSDVSQSEDRVADLHFQLSSADRRMLLSELRAGPLRINEAAKRLGMTSTEVLRQIQRLSEARLLVKEADGRYGLTLYAMLILDTTLTPDFVSRNREYFLSHDASLLPTEFRSRLGELSGGKLPNSELDSLNKVMEIFRSAKTTIDVMVDRGLDLGGQIMKERLMEGVKVRWLLHPDRLSELAPDLRSAPRLPEIRSSAKLCGAVVQTDKEAAVTLRFHDGTMSTIGFFGSDASFMKWASDLFMYEWNRAKIWHP